MSGQFLHSSTGLIESQHYHFEYVWDTCSILFGYVLVTQINFLLRFGYALTKFGYVLVTFWLRGYRPGTNLVTRIF